MHFKWQQIIKPKELEIEQESLSPYYGKFIAEPFERGFATTIGNSLRRALLSSVPGAAVTSVRIEGILHEFSTIPGVREDVTEIILNIKQVKLKLLTREPQTIYLKAKGEGVVTASDIILNNNVELTTPDIHIATLSPDASLNIEMTVEAGRGYVYAEKNKKESDPIGTIPVDSIFSPVKNVSYTVAHARVGHMIDYERLVMEIWTDGTVMPEDALAYSAKILQNQLQLFINFEEELEEPEPIIQEKKKSNENLYKTIDELELSVRSANCLRNADINFIWELVEKTEADMLKTKNFGRKSLEEIKEILEEMGLSLGMNLDDFEPLPEKMQGQEYPDEAEEGANEEELVSLDDSDEKETEEE